MTLDREDIYAIAAEVVRQMKLAESVSMDMQFLASLPPGEAKKRQKALFDATTRRQHNQATGQN